MDIEELRALIDEFYDMHTELERLPHSDDFGETFLFFSSIGYLLDHYFKGLHPEYTLSHQIKFREMLDKIQNNQLPGYSIKELAQTMASAIMGLGSVTLVS